MKSFEQLLKEFLPIDLAEEVNNEFGNKTLNKAKQTHMNNCDIPNCTCGHAHYRKESQPNETHYFGDRIMKTPCMVKDCRCTNYTRAK